VRAEADALGLRTAAKPDSQDVCFITSTTGREGFLGRRLDLHRGRVVDGQGRHLGSVAAVELVTVGQRRGLGLPGGEVPRYAVDVDVASAIVRVGPERELHRDTVALERMVWADGPVEGRVGAQCAAHGAERPATVTAAAGRSEGVVVRFDRSERRVARGQSVVLYQGDEVVGGGIARG
jgi:tRNA-specific 2-thiouridylase